MPERPLTAFIEEVYGQGHLRVEDDLGDGFVRLRTSEAERRQARHDIRSTEDIVIELLRNARDARARLIFVAVSREGDRRRITVVDDGEGVPDAMRERIFEPRVTSKLDTVHMDRWGVHGRGMALYSIAANTESASLVATGVGLGSSFVVESDLSRLPEKADQSSWPSFSVNTDGGITVRGPRNINRIIAEFAWEHRKEVSVLCGTPVQTAAALYAFGETAVSASMRAFGTDRAAGPLTKRLCYACDPAELASLCAGLGLEISERSARRILDGKVDAAPAAGDLIVIEGLLPAAPSAPSSRTPGKKPAGDARGLKVDAADIEAFSQRLKAAFADLARQYYLEPDTTPQIRVANDRIQVDFPLDKLL